MDLVFRGTKVNVVSKSIVDGYNVEGWLLMKEVSVRAKHVNEKHLIEQNSKK